MSGAIARLLHAARPKQLLCVGVDPHPEILVDWGLGDSAGGLGAFCDTILEAMQESATAVCKPQVALFERHGISGFTALARFIGAARELGIAVIADVKRGDIGTSVRGYGEAWMAPGGDFESDAMTAVAFQGVGSLSPVLGTALEHAKSVFVLAATSNPEGWAVQSATIGASGESVAASICRELDAMAPGQESSPSTIFGVVVGATVNQRELGLDLTRYPHLAILAPGFGAQGAELADLKSLFPERYSWVFPTVSRSVYSGGRDAVAALISRHQEALES